MRQLIERPDREVESNEQLRRRYSPRSAALHPCLAAWPARLAGPGSSSALGLTSRPRSGVTLFAAIFSRVLRSRHDGHATNIKLPSASLTRSGSRPEPQSHSCFQSPRPHRGSANSTNASGQGEALASRFATAQNPSSIRLMTTSDKMAGRIMGPPRQRPARYLITTNAGNRPVDWQGQGGGKRRGTL
jgi:hypothetical protein